MAARVINPTQVAFDEGLVKWRQFGGAQVFGPEQLVDGAGGDHREEFTLGVGPLVGCATVTEEGAGSHQGNQHVGIDGHVIPTADPFVEIARVLPGIILRQVVNGRAEVAASQRCTALAAAAGE